MAGRTFDAVIFDMDGVLCDSEPFIAAAAAEMLRRRYGVVATREDFLPFVGAGEDRFISGGAAHHGVTADLAIDKPLTYEIYLELIPGSLQPIRGVRRVHRGGTVRGPAPGPGHELGPAQAGRQPGRHLHPGIDV